MSLFPNFCLDQKTAKGLFGLRVKLPLAHLFTTNGGGFTLSLLMINVKDSDYFGKIFSMQSLIFNVNMRSIIIPSLNTNFKVFG